MGATRIPIPIAAPAELLCAPSPIIAHISPAKLGGKAKPAKSGRAAVTYEHISYVNTSGLAALIMIVNIKRG